MSQIEYTVFHTKDDRGNVTPDVAAHFYCRRCETNYSHPKVSEVWARATAHAVHCTSR